MTRYHAAIVMALLNAVFPALVPRQHSREIELSPYTNGLRDSIRLLVYQYLMRGDVYCGDNKDALCLKLLSWCNIPTYGESRRLLVQYFQEVKKMEDLCLDALSQAESFPMACRLSLTASSDGSRSPDALLTTATMPDLDSSGVSLYSSTVTSSTSSFKLPSILQGVPGREISASKTDGAAFAHDCGEPDILIYPNDLSRTEFHTHPLAPYIGVSLEAKANLGLIVPKERSNRGF